MSASVPSITSHGFDGYIVDIECSLSNNLPAIVIVGFANRAVNEAKERIRGAFANSGLHLPRKRITINLAPADLPKADSAFDMAIAVSIFLADGQLGNKPAVNPTSAFIGELGLDGNFRAVRGIIGKLLCGHARDMTDFFIPQANLAQAGLVPGVRLYPVSSLGALHNHFTGAEPITAIDTGGGIAIPPGNAGNDRRTEPEVLLSDIAGQSQAKRALEIAAAGGHNLLLSGPPGTGKSMLAKALSGLLPPLTRDEMLEVTHLHSLASRNYDAIITKRPFRAPHHSVSQAAITGGGAGLRPGELSLAHRGVLLFDEFPEFNHPTLEALRQPLEDRSITIARAKDSVVFPANFMLVATANPCPCGFYGTPKSCRCLPGQIQRYTQKLSGPILDRIDLYTGVHEVEHAALLNNVDRSSTNAAAKQRVTEARKRQAHRFSSPSKLNADMNNTDIKSFARLELNATELLNTAAERLSLSARAYMRTIKVSRTIADLEGAVNIAESHLSEALAYRRPSEP